MRDQHAKRTGSVALSIVAMFLMLVISVMGLTAIVSAAEENWPASEISAENFVFNGTNGVVVKEYDGSSNADLAVNPAKDTVDGHKILLTDAYFVDAKGNKTADAGKATHVKVKYELEGEGVVAHALTLSAKIVASDDLVYEVTYDPSGIKTNNKQVKLKGVNGEEIAATFIGDLGVMSVGEHSSHVAANINNTNYDASALTVIVKPLVITEVNWDNKPWSYGSKPTLKVTAADGNTYDATQVFTDEMKAADWTKGTAGNYTLVLNPNCVWGEGLIGNKINVTINPLALPVKPGITQVLGDGANVYFPELELKGISGALKAEVLNQVSYSVNGAAFNGGSFGDYLITVSLPAGSNFVLVDAKGNPYGESNPLILELRVRYESKMFEVRDPNTNKVVGHVILKSGEGFTDAVTVTAETVRGFPKIVQTKYNLVYKISITGAEEGQSFSLIVPLNDTLMTPRTGDLKEGLFFYNEETGELIAATAENEASLADDGYVAFAGIAGSVTVVVAPDYDVPFFQTVWGILLIVVLAIALLVLMCCVGLKLRRILETTKAPAITIDTVGKLPENEVVEKKIEIDENAVLEKTIDDIIESFDSSNEAAVEVDQEALDQVVDELLEELIEEIRDKATKEVVEKLAALMNRPIDVDVEVDQKALNEAVEKAINEAIAKIKGLPIEETDSKEDEEMVVEVDQVALNEEVEKAVDAAIESVKGGAVEEADSANSIEVAVEVDQEALTEAVSKAIDDVLKELKARMAAQTVEEVAEEVVEEAAEEVVEEAAEEIVEEAAEEIVEEEAEEDDDGEDGDDDAVEAVSMVEDTAFGFGASADLATFIDVKENPEAYQEMLAREARGEIKIVYRYKKSFQSKLAQSMGNVQDYYSELKNALLTFKGVKNRLSWNYEAFNKGRVHVAKMDAKSKTLYLYLALDPAQFVDTKYAIVDVSAKRKYATTPTLIKIKGERKFKHALELIEKLCGEQMELNKVEAEKVDYRVARMTIDEMVDAGLMKQSAGYIILPTEEV